MNRAALSGIGIAALTIAASTGGTADATPVTVRPVTADTASGLDARLHTVIGYLGEGRIDGLSMFPGREFAVHRGHVISAAYNVAGIEATVRDLDLSTGVSVPVLGSGFPTDQDDPNKHGALDESFNPGPGGVSVDAQGITLARGDRQIMATSATTVTAYGHLIRAGQATPVFGGGSAQADGAWATRVSSPSTAAATSASGLLATVTTAGGSQRWVVPSTDGTYFGRSMLAGRAYTMGPRLTGDDQWQQVALDAAGNLIFGTTEGISITAVDDGHVYGKDVQAGQTYQLTSRSDGQYAGSGLHVDPTGTIMWTRSSAGDGQHNGETALLPARDGSRFGLRLTGGVITELPGIPAYVPTQFDEAGNVFYSAPGEVTAVAATDQGVLGHQVAAGQQVVLYPQEAQTRFPGESGDPRTIKFHTGTADSDHGDLLASSGETTLFIPRRNGTYFGRPMEAGRPYYIFGDGRDASYVRWAPPPVGGEGKDPRSGPALARDLCFDKDGNAVLLTREYLVVVARQSGHFYGRDMAAGTAYSIAGSAQGALYPMDSVPAARASLYYATQLLADPDGNILMSHDEVDSDYSRLQVLATSSGRFYGRAMTAGNLYNISSKSTGASTGDGGPIRAAAHTYVSDLALDQATGNVFVAEQPDYAGPVRVRVLVHQSGTLLGKQVSAGNVYSVAGQDATAPTPGDDGMPVSQSYLDRFTRVAATRDGRLLLLTSDRLRRVERDGTVHTLAGHEGHPGFSPDGVHATLAYLHPRQLPVPTGNLDVTDGGNPLMAGEDGIRTFR